MTTVIDLSISRLRMVTKRAIKIFILVIVTAAITAILLSPWLSRERFNSRTNTIDTVIDVDSFTRIDTVKVPKTILVPSKKKEKKKMDKKIFNVGDIVVCIEIRSKKLSQDAIDFLSTYKYFKILDVNKNYNIDLGYVTSEGSKFYFSPNRFELKDKPKKKSIVPNEEE